MAPKKPNIYQIQADFVAFLQKKGIKGSVGNDGTRLLVSVEAPKTTVIPKTYRGYSIEVKKLQRAAKAD